MSTLYDRFIRIANSGDIVKPFETLALEYQENRSPKIFAAAYVKGIKWINQTQKKEKFNHLDQEDKDTITLIQLDACLLKFIKGKKKENSSVGAKLFLTLFLFQLNNHLIHESCQKTTQKKGRGIQNASYEELVDENHFDTGDYQKDDVEEGYIGGIELPENLSQNEFLYCWAILRGVFDHRTSNNEVAKYLEVSNTMVGYIKNDLRMKLEPVFFPM